MQFSTRALLGLVCAAAAGTAAATDVGVSVQVSQPGVYGRVDIGRFPQPQVIVQQPVVVAPAPVVVAQPVQPIYVWVPPGHRKNWGKHCHAYNACGVPVYFVRHDWYAQNVMVDERDGRGRGHDEDHGHGRGHGRGRD
jgi:hypothetical protein